MLLVRVHLSTAPIHFHCLLFRPERFSFTFVTGWSNVAVLISTETRKIPFLNLFGVAQNTAKESIASNLLLSSMALDLAGGIESNLHIVLGF